MKGTPGAGSYRTVVTVQVPAAGTPDGDGGYTPAWQDADPPTWSVSLTAAPGRRGGGGEMGEAGTVIATQTHLARGRYRADVTTAVRLALAARVFNILTVRDLDEHHRTLELVCAEVVA
jgi:head-tail adaptor